MGSPQLAARRNRTQVSGLHRGESRNRERAMDPDTWPDILIAVLASLVLVGLPGVILALAITN